MSAQSKRAPTPPDIRDALIGLTESDPPTQRAHNPSQRESLPSSQVWPISPDNTVRLPFSMGDVIAGKYEIVGLIGSGGVGYVVSARHLELDEMVALKFLREESLVHEQVVERFAREARAAARIKSEYIARVFDVGSLPNGSPFIVMEYLHGKDLADVVRERGKLPVKVVVEYMLQACQALAAAHAIGIVHRDIKPENLFLARQGEGVEVIKVLDFGISKSALTSGQSGTRKFAKTTMPMGTPAYMSPEQIRSTGEVDQRTDIWALGCVLFELLTGACAFDAPSLMQLGAAILEHDPVPLRHYLPDAPPELEALILRCLDKNVDKRYQSVAELAVALYPFAPRRARINVERSSELLRSQNPSATPLELGSVAPPSVEAARLEEQARLTHPSAVSGNLAVPSEDQELAAGSAAVKRKYLVAAGAACAVALGLAGVLSSSRSSQANEKPTASVPPSVAALAPKSAPVVVATPSPSVPAPTDTRPAQPQKVEASPTSDSTSSRKGRVRAWQMQAPAPSVKREKPAAADEDDVGY